jgi:TolB-like protein/DNA-binding winged helix-turn-helix (wHTH) protein/tetratricopeptide (TPR) repeat protein
MLQAGHGRFDPISGEFSIDGRTAKLRPRTAALLAHLLRNAGRVVGKDELMQAIWPDVVVTEDSLVQCVSEIRQALGHAGREWIRTVPRQGYAFAAETMAPAGSTPRAEPRRQWRKPVAAAFLVLVVIAALGLQLLRRADPAFAPPPLSIVVLPVVNLTGDTAHENAADNLTEDLAAALSRMSGTTVIAPRTAFTLKGKPNDVRSVGTELGVRYVLEGFLRRDVDPQLRLTVRLADTSNSAQLWAEHFAAGGGQVELRDEVVTRVAGSLGLRLISAEAHRSRRERPDDPDALDLLSRARASLRWAAQGSDLKEAVQLLEDAVRRDPGLAEAWGLLARAYSDEIRFSPTREHDLKRAGEAAERALALAPDSAAANGAKGWLLYNQGRMAQALITFKRATELNPSDVTLLASSGAAHIMLGQADEGIVATERAIRLSPRDPQLPHWQLYHGVADLHMGRNDAAVEWLARSVESNPKSSFSRLFLASAYGAAGRLDEARAQMAKFQELRPGFTLSRFRAIEPSDAPAFKLQRERVYEGLRRAGMPD